VVTFSALSGSHVAVIPANAKNSYVRFDVTSLIKSWLNGAPNEGVAIGADLSGAGVAIVLDSKENIAGGHSAMLGIELQGAGTGTQGPQGPPGPFGPQGPAGPNQVSGTYSSQVTFNNGANRFSGSFNGDASGLNNMNPSGLASGGVSSALNFNNPANNFVGTFSGNIAGLTNVSAGSMNWQAVPGTAVQAMGNSGYILTNAQLVSVTLPPFPNVGDIVRVSGVGAGGWAIAQNAGQSVQAAPASDLVFLNINPHWVPGSVPSLSWKSATSSADGTKLAAVAGTTDQYDTNGNFAGVSVGAIYTSADAGASWRSNNVPGWNWRSIASSTDGAKLIIAAGLTGSISTNYIIVCSTNSFSTNGYPTNAYATISCITNYSGTNTYITCYTNHIYCTSNVAVGYFGATGTGKIYTSTNSGASWSSNNVPGLGWSSVASSADGTKLVAAATATYAAMNDTNGNPIITATGGIYTSTNSGASWNSNNVPEGDWRTVAASADGARLFAAGTGGTGFYGSTNSGTTWMSYAQPCFEAITSLALSADGTRLLVGTYCGLFVSGDSGSTWKGVGPVLEVDWSVALSADGIKLVAVAYGDSYVSEDFGATWTALKFFAENGAFVASSADGTKLVISVDAGAIYTLQLPSYLGTSAGAAGHLSGGQNTAIELQYIGGGVFTVLSHSGTIFAY
jgi:hypothetical protein